MSQDKQSHYSTVYSQFPPTKRWLNIWPFTLATIFLIGLLLTAWWAFLTPVDNTIIDHSALSNNSENLITLNFAGQNFYIPENYIRNKDPRTGSKVDRIDLHVLWPEMSGLSSHNAEVFRDKTTHARVIYITMTTPNQLWRPAEKFYQIYPYYFSGYEQKTNFGLMQRQMNTSSGIANYDVLYHQDHNRLYLYHCMRDQPDLMPPDCVGDKIIEPNILARYRFRRTMLKDWKSIDADIEQLLGRFVNR